LPIIEYSGRRNQTLKDFTDTIVLPADTARVESVSNVQVNGRVYDGYRFDRERLTLTIPGSLSEPLLDDEDGQYKTVVTYTVTYQDDSWKVPCKDAYIVRNTAAAQGEDSGEYSDDEEVPVEVPTYAYIKVGKWLQNADGELLPEAGKRFELYKAPYGGSDLLGSAVSPERGTAIVTAEDADGGPVTELNADTYGQIAKIENPSGEAVYRLYLADADIGYPPFTPDGTRWAFDAQKEQYYLEFNLTPNPKGSLYEGKYCGPTEIVAYDRTNTGLTVVKSMPADATDSEKAAVQFYLYKGNEKIQGPSSVSAGGRIWDLRHLDYGIYTVYEVTPADFAPENTGDAVWTAASGNVPEAIQIGGGRRLYKTEIELARPAASGGERVHRSVEVANGRIPGLITVRKESEGTERGQEFHFQLIGPSGVAPVDLGGKYDSAADGSKIESAPDGRFKLKAGETVTFTGLKLGARYGVREIIQIGAPDYLEAIEGDAYTGNAAEMGDIIAAVSPSTITFKNKAVSVPPETPSPTPTPDPDPSEAPGPTPTPVPDPSEAPGPTPTPDPDPSGTPGPTPTPDPGPTEAPSPAPPPPGGGGDISDDPPAVPPDSTGPGGNTPDVPSMPSPIVPTEEVPMGPPVSQNIPGLIGLQEEDDEPPMGAPEVPKTGGEAAAPNFTGVLAALGALILALRNLLRKKTS
jgi:hypothetical protein